MSSDPSDSGSGSSISLTRGLKPGTALEGRYRIVRKLGSGGMGTVYEAEQIKLKRRVAIKVLRPERLERDDDSNSAKRFIREARAASAIDHRNVVDIVDFGDLDGDDYYVMELLRGRDLSSLLKSDGPMAWPRLRALLNQVLAALHAAHERGIIHRDIKPANIMVLDEPDPWGREWIKVLDFGIAKFQEADEDSQNLTGTSELLGTAPYMGPELARGERADARTDLYAVGILTYQLLTGVLPFQAPNTFQVLLRHLTEPPRPMRDHVSSISPTVEAFVMRVLSKEPDERYQTAKDMIEALEQLGDEPPDEVPARLRAFIPKPMGPPMTVVERASSVEAISPDVETRPLGEGIPTGNTEDDDGNDASPVVVTDATDDSSDGRPVAPVARSRPPISPPAEAPASRRSRAAVVWIGALGLLGVAGFVLSQGSDPAPDAPAVETKSEPAAQPAPAVAANASGSTTRSPTTTATDASTTTAAGSSSDGGEASSGGTGDGDGDGDSSGTGDGDTRPATTERSKPTASCTTWACRQRVAQRKLGKKVRTQCRSLGKGQRVKVKVTIGTNGKVLMPRALSPHERSVLGQCVVDVVGRGEFPAPDKLTPKTLEFKL